MIGLTWFNVFGNAAPLYMAGLAFTEYGIHWFAMAHHRFHGLEYPAGRLNGDAFLSQGILGINVFRRAADIPLFSKRLTIPPHYLAGSQRAGVS